MRKHWLYILVAFLVATTGISACSNAGADDFSCPKDPIRVIEQNQDKIKDLESEIKEQKGGIARDTQEQIDALKAENKNLEGCKPKKPKSTTTTTVATRGTEVNVDPASLKAIFEGPVDPVNELAFDDDATALLDNAPQERGAAAHSAKTLKTPEDVIEWFASGDPKAELVRDRVALSSIAQCGEADAKRIMAGEGWITIVVKPGSQVRGTSYVKGSSMEFGANWRQTGELDGYHVPVCLTGPNAGKIVANGLVRADCGNGHDNPKIRIIRPETPEAPPVETPPGEVCPFNPALPVDSPDCLKPKDPSKDANINPEIPEGVRGPGTTPVGVDPGSPEAPIDSPSGCNNACATTTTAPPSGGSGGSSPTVPVSNGGNTNVTAPPTSAPPPAPPTTSSPTVTVVSP